MGLLSRNIQSFDWGELKWISEPDTSNDSKLLIGKAVFGSQKSQALHYHPDEQVLYIEKGKGIFQIGEKKVSVEPGSIIHTDPFCRHKVLNQSNEELIIMITYLPSSNNYQSLELPRLELDYNYLRKKFYIFINDQFVQRSLERISYLMEMNISIFGLDGQLMNKFFNTPSFCKLIQQTPRGRELCKISSDPILKDIDINPGKIDVDYCCHKILRLIIPFSFQGIHLGNIVFSGFLFEKINEKDFKSIKKLEGFLGLYPGSLLEKYRQFKLVTKNNIYAASDLITSMLDNLFSYWLISQTGKGVTENRGNKEDYSEEIRAVIDYIKENVSDRFTLKEIAEHVALNPSYLSRKFKKEVGKNITQYINICKIERAKEMIKEGNTNFKEVAYSLNFTSQSYFNKVFKQVSGMSPTEYEEK